MVSGVVGDLQIALIVSSKGTSYTVIDNRYGCKGGTSWYLGDSH